MILGRLISMNIIRDNGSCLVRNRESVIFKSNAKEILYLNTLVFYQSTADVHSTEGSCCDLFPSR